MTHCAQSDTLLHPYLDGELDVVRAAEFEAHLAECAECSAALVGLDQLSRTLRTSQLHAPASASLRAKLIAQLPQEDAPPRRRFSWLWLVPVAAAAILLLAFSVYQRGTSSQIQAQLLDAHLRSLEPGHLMDVISTDQHTVKPWFDGKLDFIPPVHDFADQGFPLAGGRLDVLHGRTVAALVYTRRKHTINLFVWPEQSTLPGGDASGSSRGFNWIRWQSGDFTYYTISDTAPADLAAFMHLIEEQHQRP